MENTTLSDVTIKSVDWCSDEFVYKSVIGFLKQNGYKIHKETEKKGTEKSGRIITASKFFKKEVIEVKGFSYHHSGNHDLPPARQTYAKSWFSEALFNSFLNFSGNDHTEVAMALPNVARYQAIIEKLNEYFSVNNLYFRVYLVNEDGLVEVSNLNVRYAKSPNSVGNTFLSS